MKTRLVASICSAALCGSVSLALAGTYGDTEEPEETPQAAPVAMTAPEEEEGWRFIITPQIWGSRIEKNGFAAAGSVPGFVIQDEFGTVVNDDPFRVSDGNAVDALDVQWGVQIAAVKGRWSIGASFQTVDFETKSVARVDTRPLAAAANGPDLFTNGEIVGNEFVNTTRYDFDIAASYLFPDVIDNRLDVSLGLGGKLMYASGVRHYSNIDDKLTRLFQDLNGTASEYFTNCSNSTGCTGESRVSTSSWTYGAVIPIATVLHLDDDSTWIMPFGVAPFLGASTRDDNGVVFKTRSDGSIDKEDGTSFAWGGTSDLTLRHRLADNLWAYAGMRVQYLDMGDDQEFFAWGPLAGISASFTMD